MTTRFRERTSNSTLSGGTKYRQRPGEAPYSVQVQGELPRWFEQCSDELHAGPPFVQEGHLDKRKTTLKRRSSIDVTGGNTGIRKCENYDFAGLSPYYHAPPYPVGTQHYVNQALASLNPNDPLVDIPLFLFELREVPRMLRDLGRLLSRPHQPDIPGSYLAYKFGWAPLFGDLSTLVNLGQEIEDQRSRLTKSAHRGNASGTLDSWNTSTRGSAKRFYVNSGDIFNYHIEHSMRRRVWYSARVTPDFSNPYFGQNRFGEIESALGLNLSASTLWNAIPWSWLIDYFFSVGTYLSATRGVLPYSINSMCIMCMDETDTRAVYDGTDTEFPYKVNSMGSMKTVHKRRSVHIVPKARIGFRTNPLVGKLGILGALATKTALR